MMQLLAHKLKPLKSHTNSPDQIIKDKTTTFKWAAALSLSVKTPVDSTTYSAPVWAHGISSGFLQQFQNKIIRQLYTKIKHFIEVYVYLDPKTATDFSPKSRVLSSLTLSSWCFQAPWTLSYLNIYVYTHKTKTKTKKYIIIYFKLNKHLKTDRSTLYLTNFDIITYRPKFKTLHKNKHR